MKTSLKTSLLWILCVMATLSFGLTAQAQEASRDELSLDAWTRAPDAIDLHLGLFTPQGSLGVSYTHTWDRYFAFSASAGLGGYGLNVSMTPRVQLPWSWGAVGFGLGVTASPYESYTLCLWPGFGCPEGETAADLIFWVNPEIYLILQDPESGLRFGLYGGVTSGFAALGARFEPDDKNKPAYPINASNILDTLPFAGLFIGYAF